MVGNVDRAGLAFCLNEAHVPTLGDDKIGDEEHG